MSGAATPADAGAGAAPAAAVVLAFDWGEQRTGIALGNTLTRSARPLCIVPTVPSATLFGHVGALIAQWTPDRLVVGRPLSADGDVQPLTLACERFARRLHGRFALPVHLVDERYSSVQARAQGRAAGRRGPVDDAAAAVILEQYLDALPRR